MQTLEDSVVCNLPPSQKGKIFRKRRDSVYNYLLNRMVLSQKLTTICKCLPNIREFIGAKCISTTAALNRIHLNTRLRVVDNSTLGKQAMLAGKPPYCIYVYKPGKRNRDSTAGKLGDRVLVAILGQLKRGYIVGWKMDHTKIRPNFPRIDSNNLVLLDDNGNPMGTRILVPVPSMLRGMKNMAKILAIATKFV